MLKIIKRYRIAKLLKKYPDIFMFELAYHDLTSNHHITKINEITAPDYWGSQTCSSIASLAFPPSDEYKQFLVEAEIKSDNFIDFILELQKILGSNGCPGIYTQEFYMQAFEASNHPEQAFDNNSI